MGIYDKTATWIPIEPISALRVILMIPYPCLFNTVSGFQTNAMDMFIEQSCLTKKTRYVISKLDKNI